MFKRIREHVNEIQQEYAMVNNNKVTKGIIDTCILVIDLIIMLIISIGAITWISSQGSWLTVVDGKSMYPTLEPSQLVFVEKTEIERGDIITVNAYNYTEDYSKQKLFIKRVVGMPGDRIIIKDNQVIINDEVLDEPYLTDEAREQTMTQIKYDSVKLTDNEYFVMGDNRGNSYDSRHFGVIKENEIMDKQSVALTDFAKSRLVLIGGVLVLDIVLFFLVEFVLTECAYIIILKSKKKQEQESEIDYENLSDEEIAKLELEMLQNSKLNNINKITTSETVILEGDKK